MNMTAIDSKNLEAEGSKLEVLSAYDVSGTVPSRLCTLSHLMMTVQAGQSSPLWFVVDLPWN